MSDATPIFIENLNTVLSHLKVLAAQDVAAWQDGMSPEAMQHHGKDLYERFTRMVGMVREQVREMGRSLETIKDLQVAKHPDVEHLAKELLVHNSRIQDPKSAYDLARKMIKHRDEERAIERRGDVGQIKKAG